MLSMQRWNSNEKTVQQWNEILPKKPFSKVIESEPTIDNDGEDDDKERNALGKTFASNRESEEYGD